ncbi:short-chain dehydrogenase [Frankia sp. CcI49]|uniref:3-oxoacyl-[acyl-carrier protein] reductase n=1 Tax=Parafrankia irregularis TaxID=795642 RepID=A0A0S4QDE6_9ACTN|nr:MULTISPECIES: 3-oxoacyl-ACP reductase FabG [Frankiaceae]EFC86578.1 short-chain dehydrogenase/reductase SDR [Parafrankia sp. EUN1f]KPM55086.1 short-chain dehydrogenase [Frankia sp. R43]MBE3199764.1 3-oxoacyl-ACP reductase FabG [Parafrankia sp. CH37]ONH56247.1 short-chain dehydrogenase [Frankia sp. CcI49]CUU53563.1 3-oxoacyl-[acyl-carrier protein] reductase [Parafrankia irregularis]
MFPDLAGKRALVTGGTRGIGRSVVLGLAQAGATVVVGHQRETEEAESLRRELKATGNEHLLVQADVADPAQITELIAATGAHLGGLDIVVNSVGTISHVPYAQLPLEAWTQVLSTNLTATHLVTQGALELLGDSGTVINIGSGAGVVGVPLRAHYTAAKTGLIGLTRSLSKELGSKGIRVNLVSPGVIETDQAAGMPEAARTAYTNRIPLGRLGEAHEVAAVVLFLASDVSSYVNGATFTVDGGI